MNEYLFKFFENFRLIKRLKNSKRTCDFREIHLFKSLQKSLKNKTPSESKTNMILQKGFTL